MIHPDQASPWDEADEATGPARDRGAGRERYADERQPLRQAHRHRERPRVDAGLIRSSERGASP